MGNTLWLLETRAKNDYRCPACGRQIVKGSVHFRHDPHPFARTRRGQKITHWCSDCIAGSSPGSKDAITRRIRVPALRVLSRSLEGQNSERVELVRIEVISVGELLSAQLSIDPTLIHHLTPDQFEEFICDRLAAMGLVCKRVGATNRKDGGIDVVFWPRQKNAFPFLGAAQIKHHQDSSRKEGPASVREFQGVMGAYPINAGLIVTNTRFSPDASWFAKEHARLLRLRDFSDIRRWLLNDFTDEAEWRELPKTLELCPGVVVKIR